MILRVKWSINTSHPHTTWDGNRKKKVIIFFYFFFLQEFLLPKRLFSRTQYHQAVVVVLCFLWVMCSAVVYHLQFGRPEINVSVFSSIVLKFYFEGSLSAIVTMLLSNTSKQCLHCNTIHAPLKKLLTCQKQDHNNSIPFLGICHVSLFHFFSITS